MDKKKIKLGTYSNEGLGMGLANVQFSEEQLIEANKIIQEDLKKLKPDFLEHLHRLEELIKKDIGAIPRTENFILWLFDKKKISQTGKKLPEITDEEIIDFAKEYTENLRNYIHFSNKDTFLKLNYASKNQKVIRLLYDNLSPEKIEVDFEDFERIFQNEKVNAKIRWKSTETEFVNLFSQIKFENLNIFEILSKYFLNKKGASFKADQLSVSKSKSTDVNYRGKAFVESIIFQIKTL